MKMKMLGLLLTIATVNLPTVVADFNTVLNDLKTVDGTNNQLTSRTNAYTGTASQSVMLKSTSNNLQKQINQTTTDTNASSVPTSAQAQTVLDYINNTLFPDTMKTQTATRNKKAPFKSAGVLPQVIQDVKGIKGIVDILAVTLINKAPTAAQKSSGQTTRTKFANAFQDEINFLSA